MRDLAVADWVGVADARAAILGSVAPLGPESVPLDAALGAVLAETIHSPLDLPPWDNSAMDGFAVRADDVRGATPDRPRRLAVVDDLPAGARPSRAVGPGEAIRIMTGAPLPVGADGVVRVEHTDGGHAIGTPGAWVEIRSDADAGRNVRRRGEELRRGDPVLGSGTLLSPGAIGMAATVGRASLPTIRRPTVAVVASGDELVEVEHFEQVLRGGRIVGSNSPALAAAIREVGCEPRVLGIARDTPASLRGMLEAARGADAIVSTAGVSVGEHDHTRAVLAEMQLDAAFWRVRIRPGSPFAFGRVGALGGIPWFGLPGNPVSALVCFALFVRPALLRMAGHAAVHLPTVRATLADAYPAPAGLTHFPRVRLARDPHTDGWIARLAGPQGSGMLSSVAAADALLVVPPEPGGALPGARLPAVLLAGAPPQTEPGF